MAAVTYIQNPPCRDRCPDRTIPRCDSTKKVPRSSADSGGIPRFQPAPRSSSGWPPRATPSSATSSFLPQVTTS